MLSEKSKKWISYTVYIIAIIINLFIIINYLIPLQYISAGFILVAILATTAITILLYILNIYIIYPTANNITKRNYIILSIIFFMLFYIVLIFKPLFLTEFVDTIFPISSYVLSYLNGYMTIKGVLYYFLLYFIQLAPLGVIMPIVFKKMNHTLFFTIFIIAISLILQLIKLILNISVIELDKVIFNILGALTTYLIFEKYIFQYSTLYKNNYLPII